MADDSDFIANKGFPAHIQKRIDAGMGCYSSIGKGWLPLLIEMDKELAKRDPNYVLDQVKEKFGGLRVYITSPGEIDFWPIMEQYENKSFEICEICGEHGAPYNKDRWIRTRCDKHIG